MCPPTQQLINRQQPSAQLHFKAVCVRLQQEKRWQLGKDSAGILLSDSAQLWHCTPALCSTHSTARHAAPAQGSFSSCFRKTHTCGFAQPFVVGRDSTDAVWHSRRLKICCAYLISLSERGKAHRWEHSASRQHRAVSQRGSEQRLLIPRLGTAGNPKPAAGLTMPTLRAPPSGLPAPGTEKRAASSHQNRVLAWGSKETLWIWSEFILIQIKYAN